MNRCYSNRVELCLRRLALSPIYKKLSRHLLFLITINREVKAFILIGTLQGFWLYKRFIVRQFVGLTGNIRQKKK